MKKLLGCLLLCLLFCGCSERNGPEPTVPAVTQQTLPQVKTVAPLPGSIDLDNLQDCTLAVSLTEGDAYVDDTGIMQMKVTVYRYDLYDIVDISQLSIGDTILITGQPVVITQLDRNENGSVLINGGLDVGGYELCTDEHTVYYQTGYSDVKAWQEVGQVTLRVSPDFQYVDRSDPDREPIIRYPGDFLIPAGGIDYFFTPHNTTITVENSTVIAMERIYTP